MQKTRYGFAFDQVGGSELALIDCREIDEYRREHIRNATSIPAAQLFQRMHELPKRQQSLVLCGNEQSLKQAREYLLGRGHIIEAQLLWADELRQVLKQQGKLESGLQSRQLWKPAPLWQRFVDVFIPQYGIQPGKGMDIACGAGRDMVYLAQQGWKMTGVDYSVDALQRVATLADYSGVTVETRQLDLERGGELFADGEWGHFDLITVGRYLHRPLFPTIKRLLKPGGVVLYQTFMQGCEDTAIGRPRNPNFLLKPGELAEIFEGATIWLDEVEMLEDGRPVAAFIAQVG